MNRNSNIQKMLNDELECFKEIHASSKLIADDLNEATNDTLVNLLIEREKRIKTVQLIENERKSLDISEQKLKLNWGGTRHKIQDVRKQNILKFSTTVWGIPPEISVNASIL